MRKVKKTGLIICFMGIDGSGKSTLSKYLLKELRRREYNASRIWWLECESSLLRRLLRIIFRFKRPTRSYSNNLKIKDRSRIFRTFYPKIILIDYLKFGIIKVLLPKIVARKKILILDRFIYDTILALSNEFNYSRLKKIRLLKLYSRLLPNPDLIFIIEVPPEISYSRKKKEIKSIENTKELWKNYQEMYSLLPEITSAKIIKIDNTREIETVKAEILNNTLEFLGAL